MKLKNIKTFSRALTVLSVVMAPSQCFAQDATGTWLVAERDAHVRIASCGAALCGWISWLKDPSASTQAGRRVIWDMKTSGDGEWIGKVFNPRDGNTYSGKMKVSGEALAVTGCVFGGSLCRTFAWERVR